MSPGRKSDRRRIAMYLEYVSHEHEVNQPFTQTNAMKEIDSCIVTLRTNVRTLRLISAMGQQQAITSDETAWAHDCASVASAADIIQDRVQKDSGIRT
jgi:hypothetical protein